tara:strand:- start:399 stop:545 length:147 start_codon:yes stop_codon:yes gene_type:complete
MGKKKTTKSKKAKVTSKHKTPVEWLRKAYIDNDPKDGAPKVADIGYVI